MRIRPVLAIALLALGSGAPTLAAQVPAQEVKFLEVNDPYEWFGGLATRTIAQTGAIYVFDPSYGGGIAAFFVDYPDLGVSGYWSPHAAACYSDQECVNDRAINRAGRVVGEMSYFVNLGSPPVNWARPIHYQYSAQGSPPPLEVEYLTTPPGYPAAPTSGAYAIANAISSAGLIAGVAKSSNPAVGLAPILWGAQSGLTQELPRLPGANAGPFPVRISDLHTIIGNTGGNAPQRAAAWRLSYGGGYSLALLGELPGGTSSRAYDVAFFGGVVGSSDDGSGTHVAVVWREFYTGYTVTPLPVPEGGSCSAATAINTNGDIAGNCTLSSGAERGVVWRKVFATYELLHELEPLPGHARSIAYALDNDGQAGGGSGPPGEERAVLWPVVTATPVSLPALSNGALLGLIAALAGASVARLRAHR